MLKIENIVQALQGCLGGSATLKVVDESFKHSDHFEMQKVQGVSHIFVEIIWNGFADLSLLQRHKIVNEWLLPFFKQGLHSARYKLNTHVEC
jgi:stress-induced morphogen